MLKADLNLLRVLLAVYDTGSVTAAATRLSMSQPAVSAALSRLRRSLNDPLFVRQGAHMKATPRVELVIERARDALEIIDRDVLSPPSFQPRDATGELTFCLSEIGEVTFFPRIYLHMRQVAPGLRLKTVSMAPHALEEGLRTGEVDTAIGYFPDLDGSSFLQQRLFSHELTCLVRRDHPIRGPRMTHAEFRQTEHLMVKDGSRRQEMFEQYMKSKNIVRRVGAQTSHYMNVPTMILQSDLIVMLPRRVANRLVQEADVRIVEPPYEFPSYDLKQYWHRLFNNDPKSRWLRGEIAALFAES